MFRTNNKSDGTDISIDDMDKKILIVFVIVVRELMTKNTDKWVYRDDYGINEDYPVQSIQPNLYFDDEKLNYLHSECEMVFCKNVAEKPQELCWECKNAITKIILFL